MEGISRPIQSWRFRLSTSTVHRRMHGLSQLLYLFTSYVNSPPPSWLFCPLSVLKKKGEMTGKLHDTTILWPHRASHLRHIPFQRANSRLSSYCLARGWMGFKLLVFKIQNVPFYFPPSRNTWISPVVRMSQLNLMSLCLTLIYTAETETIISILRLFLKLWEILPHAIYYLSST